MACFLFLPFSTPCYKKVQYFRNPVATRKATFLTLCLFALLFYLYWWLLLLVYSRSWTFLSFLSFFSLVEGSPIHENG